jgi:hypothetical protein
MVLASWNGAMKRRRGEGPRIIFTGIQLDLRDLCYFKGPPVQQKEDPRAKGSR